MQRLQLDNDMHGLAHEVRAQHLHSRRDCDYLPVLWHVVVAPNLDDRVRILLLRCVKSRVRSAGWAARDAAVVAAAGRQASIAGLSSTTFAVNAFGALAALCSSCSVRGATTVAGARATTTTAAAAGAGG